MLSFKLKKVIKLKMYFKVRKYLKLQLKKWGQLKAKG